jgi:hypothetical protein
MMIPLNNYALTTLRDRSPSGGGASPPEEGLHPYQLFRGQLTTHGFLADSMKSEGQLDNLRWDSGAPHGGRVHIYRDRRALYIRLVFLIVYTARHRALACRPQPN